MRKKALAVAEINFKTIRPAYWVAGMTMAALICTSILTFIVMTDDSGTLGELSPSNALWLLPVLAAILIPARNFSRTINLGAKRADIFWGNLVVYAILAASVSFVTTLTNFTIEPILERSDYLDPAFFGGVANLTEVFGWSERGVFAAFIQQFAFLFLFSCFVHTLTVMNHKWYGWAADIAIIAIISVFTPIAPLRAALVWFFNLIMFHQSAALQFAACLGLGILIYALSKPIMARLAV